MQTNNTVVFSFISVIYIAFACLLFAVSSGCKYLFSLSGKKIRGTILHRFRAQFYRLRSPREPAILKLECHTISSSTTLLASSRRYQVHHSPCIRIRPEHLIAPQLLPKSWPLTSDTKLVADFRGSEVRYRPIRNCERQVLGRPWRPRAVSIGRNSPSCECPHWITCDRSYSFAQVVSQRLLVN